MINTGILNNRVFSILYEKYSYINNFELRMGDVLKNTTLTSSIWRIILDNDPNNPIYVRLLNQ